MNTVPAGQYRTEQVQILNWGGYAGLQVMQAGRASTAILGPSGRGKSTLLDGMASVIMPNPQEFNQAARDDKGRKRERTVYTYARGLTVSHRDDNGRSATPSYLRPPGGPGFISGAAITWSTGTGKRVTAFRLAWVAMDATDNASISGNSTVYGFVHDAFDLACLDGLKPARVGAAPLSEASMRHLIDPARGDLVDHSQPRMHAAMRRTLQMGQTEESQRLAMQLLRRAQASKGIFSINDLFKQFVLTEPCALARWDVTLKHYREAARLYEEFELAKTKAETLRELPVVAGQYRSAGRDAAVMRALAQPPASGTARLQVWHARKVLDWAYTYEEDVRLDLAQAEDDLQRAQARQREAQETERDALNALTSSGADQTALIRERIERAQEKQREIGGQRAAMAARLKAFDQVLPSSSGDLELLRAALAQQAAELAGHLEELSEEYEAQAGEKRRLATAITQLKDELERVSKQTGNIPHEADELRRRIADGAKVPAGRLQYIGELLDIPPEHRGWERAILTIVRPLASDLLVPTEDFAAVRAWVNSHPLGGDITLVPGVAHRPVRAHQPGTVAAMLDTTAADRYQGWLSEELERFTYLCVEKDTDLEGPRPGGVVGRVTRAGMRTAPNRRVTKADAPRRYRWVGRDNSALRAELEDELNGLRRQLDDVARQADIARGQVQVQQARIDELNRLQNDLSWEDLDLEPTARRLDALAGDLGRADNPEQRARRIAYDTAQQKLFDAKSATARAQQDLERFNRRWGAVLRAQDAANDMVDGSPPLNPDELAAAASLPFKAPALDKLDLSGRDIDDKTDAAVQASYLDAAGLLEGLIRSRDADRVGHERILLMTIQAYRNIDDRTHRAVDDAIESLPALEHIHQQLVTDDLPRARTDWLTKVDADLNQGLRALLQQIDVDRREITRGLGPINAVLARVPFRDGSHLAIEPADRPNSNLQEFRKIVLAFTRDNPLGEDLFSDETKVEASFRRLRKSLERLTEASQAGESWRRSVFDAREHVTFRAIETPPSGKPIMHEGVSGMSGGEGQELIAFILGAALRYRLGEGGQTPPTYGSVMLDEGFVKADSDYTGRSLRALQELGFQLIIGAPREKATAFEDYVDLVAYISTDPDNPNGVRIYSMTIQEALQLDQNAA
jgi:uncharacterized protein YPO0396